MNQHLTPIYTLVQDYTWFYMLSIGNVEITHQRHAQSNGNYLALHTVSSSYQDVGIYYYFISLWGYEIVILNVVLPGFSIVLILYYASPRDKIKQCAPTSSVHFEAILSTYGQVSADITTILLFGSSTGIYWFRYRSIEYNFLGGTGTKVSNLSFGTSTIGGQSHCVSVLAKAFNHKYFHLQSFTVNLRPAAIEHL